MANVFVRFKQMSLIQSLETMHEDLQKASDEPNFEKAHNYSAHFPQVLLLIFGIDQQTELSWIETIYANIVKVSNESSISKIYQHEFFLLISLLSPPFDHINNKNLFTFALADFNKERRYEFEVKRLPQNTQLLLEKKRYDNPTLIGYFSFLELGKNAISQDGKRLVLTIFEFYIFALIGNMKRFIGKNHVELKSSEDYLCDDFEKEFQINPYLILVRRYLEFFYQRSQKYGKLFKMFLFLLQDFTINDFIYSPVLSMNRYSTNNASINAFQNNIKVPKPHIFQVVFLVIHYLHKNYESDTKTTKSDYLMSSGFFAKSLYHFFTNVLEVWNNDVNNNSNLLSDLGKVWISFLKPWEIDDNYCIVNYLNRIDEGKHVENICFGSLIKEYQPSKELSKRENAQFISHFLKENVLFYTHVFAQFLHTLSEQNEIHFKDLIFLQNLLEFFLGNNNIKPPLNSFFNGFIKVNWIKQLSTGGNNKIEGTLDVMQYLDFMGSKLHNLNLFNDDALLSRVLKMISNLTRYETAFKKKKASERYFERNNDFQKFLIEVVEKNVHLIIDQLITMFSIEANQADSLYREFDNKQDVSMKFRKQIRNKVDKKQYLSWETPLSPNESELLYHIFFYLARMIDWALKKNQIGYSRVYPKTNLRIFCNWVNVCVLLLVLSLVGMVFYLIFCYVFGQ